MQPEYPANQSSSTEGLPDTNVSILHEQDQRSLQDTETFVPQHNSVAPSDHNQLEALVSEQTTTQMEQNDDDSDARSTHQTKPLLVYTIDADSRITRTTTFLTSNASDVITRYSSDISHVSWTNSSVTESIVQSSDATSKSLSMMPEEQQPPDNPGSMTNDDINNASKQSQVESSYMNMIGNRALKHRASDSSIQTISSNYFGINDGVYVSSRNMHPLQVFNENDNKMTPERSASIITVKKSIEEDYNNISLLIDSPLNLSRFSNVLSSLSKKLFVSNSNNRDHHHSTKDALHNSDEQMSVYPALLSTIASAFREQIPLRTHYVNSVEYKKTFNGYDAVDTLCLITETSNRTLALLIGRALGAQQFFRDVIYEHRLRDSPNEIYELCSNNIVESIVDVDHGIARLSHNMHHNDDNNDDDDDHSDNSSIIPTRSKSVSSTLNTLPNGIFTLLTDCYSSTCSRDALCYSIYCPRRLEQQARVKMRLAGVLERATTQSDRISVTTPTSWIESVPKEISDMVSKEEQKRQEIIYEIVYTEHAFVENLETLERLYIEPLRFANIIQHHAELEEFITRVFHNISSVRQTSMVFVQTLIERQEEKAVVERVGDIFLNYVDNLESFASYSTYHRYSEYYLNLGMQRYKQLSEWLRERDELSTTHRLSIQHFLARPLTRLARYPLLIRALLRATPVGHPDKSDLVHVLRRIRTLMKDINAEVDRSEKCVHLIELNDKLHDSPSEQQDLDLLNPQRQLIHKGILSVQTATDQIEVVAYLLDHYLLLVRKHQLGNTEGYVVYEKPIPLRLLVITVTNEPRMNDGLFASISPFSNRRSKSQEMNHIITIRCIGRANTEIRLIAPSHAECCEWRDKIEMQCQVTSSSQSIFDVIPLSNDDFPGKSRINCVTMLDEGRLIIGTDDGVYVKIGSNSVIMTKKLNLDKVHRIEVLESYNLILILHDKNGTLTSYSMDHLLSSGGEEAAATAQNGRKLRTKVSFFKAGTCLNRTFVCAVRSLLLYSTIEVLEPIPIASGRRRTFDLFSSNKDKLKTYREFYVSSESSSIHFLKNKLCLACKNGFMILDLETKDTISLLDPADTNLNDVLLRRDDLHAIAIFRMKNNSFLLCYNEFAIFVDKKGRRSQLDSRITWEGEPSAFAIDDPYIVAFSADFIEVRHVVTGELVQIIKAGILQSVNIDASMIQCATMNDDDDGSQRIFQLVRNPQEVKDNITIEASS